jgi:2-haloalkanoic acid dehalogenase type II
MAGTEKEAMENSDGGYEALTFDCYGTLVDWRAGLLSAVRSSPSLAGVSVDEARFLRGRQEEENRLESGPYLPYREVVAASVTAALAGQGITLPVAEAQAIARSVGDWEPFPDTRAALEILGAGRRLAIVSNVDRADIERTVERIGVRFAAIVTAEEVRSYKPLEPHFREVLRRLRMPGESVLHVAQSLYHDIRPVLAVGGDCAWINRTGEPLPAGLVPTFQLPDLASLAAAIGRRG